MYLFVITLKYYFYFCCFSHLVLSKKNAQQEKFHEIGCRFWKSIQALGHGNFFYYIKFSCHYTVTLILKFLPKSLISYLQFGITHFFKFYRSMYKNSGGKFSNFERTVIILTAHRKITRRWKFFRISHELCAARRSGV